MPLGKGFEHLGIKIGLIFFCFNYNANNYRDKYLRGEGDSDSYLLTNLMVPYMLQYFLDRYRVKVGKGFEPRDIINMKKQSLRLCQCLLFPLLFIFIVTKHLNPIM